MHFVPRPLARRSMRSSALLVQGFKEVDFYYFYFSAFASVLVFGTQISLRAPKETHINLPFSPDLYFVFYPAQIYEHLGSRMSWCQAAVVAPAKRVGGAISYRPLLAGRALPFCNIYPLMTTLRVLI